MLYMYRAAISVFSAMSFQAKYNILSKRQIVFRQIDTLHYKKTTPYQRYILIDQTTP